MSQKSYDNKAKVYLIPTPIGNIDDITIRALKTLESLDIIFSEDTRETSLLFKQLNIQSKKLISSHNFNENKNQEKLLSYLESGISVGIVSDRGTPVISDPGYELAKIAMEKGYNVIGLPGPTALIPALIVSGISPSPFLFYGFLNNKSSKRDSELENLKMEKATIILYESPHRIKDTLKSILKIMGDRHISISREISKKYEEVYRGSISCILEELGEPRGEFVIIIEGLTKDDDLDSLNIKEHVELYINDGYKTMDAIKMVSKDRGISKNEVYKQYHNL